MRALIVAMLCTGFACSYRNQTPAAPNYAFVRIASEARPTTTNVLVLSTAGTDREKSAAFLAAFCNWMRTTPTISERYGAVYLDPSVEGDLLGKGRETVGEIKTVDKSPDVTKTDEMMTAFVQERREQYRCGGTGVVGDDATVTLLQVSYGTLEPYGVGLRYLAATKGTSAQRGFFELHSGDIAGDARRFAAMLLSDPEDAIAMEVSVRTPPEARCLAEPPGVLRPFFTAIWVPEQPRLCIYQPSTVRLDFQFHDSPFVPAKDIVPLKLDEWKVMRNGKLDPDSAQLSMVSNNTVDFHPRRVGVYRLFASFGARGVPLRRDYELEVRVVPAALLFGGGFDFGFLVSKLFRGDFGWRPPPGNPPIMISVACLKRPRRCNLDVEWLQQHVGDRLGAYHVISAGQLDWWARKIRARLTHNTRSEPWRAAIEAAIGDDEVRDGIRRMQNYGTDPRRWCDAIAESSRALFQRQTGSSISVLAVSRLIATCIDELDTIDAERAKICPSSFKVPSLDSSWTIPMPMTTEGCMTTRFSVLRRGRANWAQIAEGVPITRGDTTWMTLNTDPGAVEGPFGSSVVVMDEDGVPTDPIDMTINDEGPPNSLHALAYVGVVAQKDANSHFQRELARGIHVGLSLWELFTPFGEREWAERARWRFGTGFSPWCLAEGARAPLCRSVLLEFDYAATFGSDGGYEASTVGFRASLWPRAFRHLEVSGWVRGWLGELNVGLAAGLGF